MITVNELRVRYMLEDIAAAARIDVLKRHGCPVCGAQPREACRR